MLSSVLGLIAFLLRLYSFTIINKWIHFEHCVNFFFRRTCKLCSLHQRFLNWNIILCAIWNWNRDKLLIWYWESRDNPFGVIQRNYNTWKKEKRKKENSFQTILCKPPLTFFHQELVRQDSRVSLFDNRCLIIIKA